MKFKLAVKILNWDNTLFNEQIDSNGSSRTGYLGFVGRLDVVLKSRLTHNVSRLKLPIRHLKAHQIIDNILWCTRTIQISIFYFNRTNSNIGIRAQVNDSINKFPLSRSSSSENTSILNNSTKVLWINSMILKRKFQDQNSTNLSEGFVLQTF